jgi:predicted O-methyltransferase YrrM
MKFLFWATRPRLLAARLRYWIWEKRNPDKPWLCPGTIAFCEASLAKTMNSLEFGSGRSTLWFASLVGRLTSVEHDQRWYQEIRAQLARAQVSNVDYLNVPIEHPLSAPERSSYDPVPQYVKVADRFADHSLDFIVVDGHYRTTCIRHVAPKLAPGGYLLVDDAQRWTSLADLGVPSSWRIVDDSSNGLKRCVVWQAT